MERANKVPVKKITIIAFLMLAGALFTLAYLALTGNMVQAYSDYVIENTASRGANISAERFLTYLLYFLGIGLYFLLVRKNLSADDAGHDIGEAEYVPPVVFTAALTYVAVFGNIYAAVIAAAAFAASLLKKHREICGYFIILFFVMIFALLGIYRAYVLLGGTRDTDMFFIVGASLFLSFVVLAAGCFGKAAKKTLIAACMAAQIFVPLVLLMYFKDKYITAEDVKVIPVPLTVKLFVGTVIAVFIAEAVIMLKNAVKNKFDNGSIITLGACVSAAAYDRFFGEGAIITLDPRHPFENVMGFAQIFKYGQIPFRDYAPASGMFSVFNGAFFKLFGNGSYSNFNIAQNTFYLVIIIFTMYLLKKRLNDIFTFLYAMFFIIGYYEVVGDYNRFIFILPIMLILSDPKNIARKNLWLKLWILTSLFHGIYYPVFGAAVCLGFLPLGIYQFVGLVKSKEFAVQRKKVSFWLNWVLCIAPVIACIPILWALFLHIKNMSGQSLYADGSARFAQTPLERFFPYLSDDGGIREILLYVLSFVMPAAVGWISFAAALKAGSVCFESKKIKVLDKTALLSAISVVIMLPVAYSFTSLRSDFESIFSRSNGVMYAAAGLLTVTAFAWIKNKYTKMPVLCIMFSLPVFAFCSGPFQMYNGGTKAGYTVKDRYVYVKDGEFENLDEGFMLQEFYDLYKSDMDNAEKLDLTKAYFGLYRYMGEYCLTGVKPAGMVEYRTLKGYDAAAECADMVKKAGAYVKLSDDIPACYYFYHWLLTSGEYVWSDKDGFFIPNTGTKEDAERINATYKGNKDVVQEYEASSFGNSMFSLYNSCFSDAGVNFNVYPDKGMYKIVFEQPVKGDMADFVYLKLSAADTDEECAFYDRNGKYVYNKNGLKRLFGKRYFNPGKNTLAVWFDENGEQHSCTCKTDNGELLLPLGADPGWLFGSHGEIYILTVDDKGYAQFAVENVKFLKMREIKRDNGVN